MPALIPYFLLLHILGAIGAFGPTFAFPIIGGMAAKEPQARPFVARLNLRIVTVMVIPLALSMAVTGSLLIWSAGIDLTKAHWLDLAIVLYVVTIVLSLGVGYPNIRRLAELASGPPPSGSAGAPPSGAAGAPLSGPSGAPPPGASGPPPTGGPPPEVMQRVERAKRIGMAQTALIISIAFLMVVKPSF